MKILLIYPYPLFDRSQEEDIQPVPMGLYYVGAVLKENGYDVEILNWFDIHRTPQKVPEVLMEKKADIIGFSVLNANRWGAVELARIAKQLDPKVKIVFGGVGATFLWKHFLKHFPQIDFVVLGEGEYTFLHLVKWIGKGRDQGLNQIKGIAFRRNNKITKTQKAEPIRDLDALPIPAKYFDYQHVSISRGCPWKCAFCGSPAFWGKKIRFYSPENFVAHLEILHSKGVTFFYVSDDNFTIRKKEVIEVCRSIIEKGLNITWVAISRVSYVNEEVLSWMRRAGCTQISYGIESGSAKIRDLLNKNVRIDDVKNAFALTRKYGIVARAYFIYGSPEETQETIQETIDLIHEIKPLICVLYILEIYPGTRLYSDYQKKFSRTDDVWLERKEGICYFETDPNLSREQVLEFGRAIRTAFYEGLGDFVEDIRLVDEKDFYPLHADFCSRLGMTFSHGDYANIEAIRDRDRIAERLFRRSLAYHPDARAYFGLGLLHQKKKDFVRAAEVLSEGVGLFPESAELNLCLGITHMNLGAFKQALSYLQKLEDSPEARYYIEQCRNQLSS